VYSVVVEDDKGLEVIPLMMQLQILMGQRSESDVL